MAEKLSLGGREYVRAGVGPARQDLWVMHHARHSGLSPMQQGETPEAYMNRLLDGVLSSDRALLLLGGLLLPATAKPEDWTADMAHATAQHLGSIIEPGEKSKLYAEVASALLGFFSNGIGSWVASAVSSAAAAGPLTSSSTDGTESGPGPSAPSPGTTTTRRRGFWAGLWRRSSSRTGTGAARGILSTTATSS